MAFIAALWLPILVSALLVFFASAVMWMVMPHHKSDWSEIREDDPLLSFIADREMFGGMYTFPAGMMRERDAERRAALKEKPSGFVVVAPRGGWSMGSSLAKYLIYNIVISIFAAYLAWHVLPHPGADYLSVFRVVGTATVLAYSAANVQNSIWWGHRWSNTWKQVFDGIIYGLLTAGTFGWLWPR